MCQKHIGFYQYKFFSPIENQAISMTNPAACRQVNLLANRQADVSILPVTTKA